MDFLKAPKKSLKSVQFARGHAKRAANVNRKQKNVCMTRDIIYIYKTVVCDRVLTLYRPCAYPGAVLRHASGPTGARNSSRSFSPFIKSSLPGSSKSRCSRKQTKPSLSKINNSTLKIFLSKGIFSTLSWFCGLVRPRFKILPSTYRPYVVSTKNRHVVLPSRRVPEIWNRSPFTKSSIPGSSKSRCSRKQTKPSLSTTLL